MLRKWISLCAALLTVSLTIPMAAHAASDLSVDWQGTKIAETAVEQNGKLYLALTPVCEKLGYTVTNTGNGDEVLLTDGLSRIVIDPAKGTVDENGHVVNVPMESAEDKFGAGCIKSGSQLCMERGLLEDCLGLDVLWDAGRNTVSIRRVMENMLSVKTVRDSSETNALKMEIQYPQITDASNPAAAEKINTVLKQAAQSAEAEAAGNVRELQASVAAGADSYQCETYFNYSVRYNRNGLLSVVLTDYQYTGGAHGLTVQYSHTFDLRTGAEISLAGLMKNSGYTAAVNTFLRNVIHAKEASGDLDEISNEPFQTISAKQDYYLSNRGIVVYFQEYEHFPYAAGIQEFPLGASVVRPLLKPAFFFLAED